MKPVKLTKKMLKMHPMDLLVKLGMVDPKKTRVFPEKVYFSKEDYEELRTNLKKSAEKQNSMASERWINYSVGMDMLSYGPSERLGDVIRPGWALLEIEQD